MVHLTMVILNPEVQSRVAEIVRQLLGDVA